VAPAHASVLALESLLEFPREMEARARQHDAARETTPTHAQNDARELAAVRALMRGAETPPLDRLLALRCARSRRHGRSMTCARAAPRARCTC